MSKGLEAARLRQQELRDSGGIVRRDPILKANANKKSLRLAINAKCCECMGGPSEPNWRAFIGECTSPGYPLHPVRPHQRKL